jgi:hypothetical protein
MELRASGCKPRRDSQYPWPIEAPFQSPMIPLFLDVRATVPGMVNATAQNETGLLCTAQE